MHTKTIEPWAHDHAFGQENARAGERRTIAVVVITAVMMVAEIAAGLAFGSMALLADGLHMASHACALTISALAYYYTRRHARDERFSFGTGKINSLAAFASAVLLVAFALVMAWESSKRLLSPVGIGFTQATWVAAIGLGINVLCLAILGVGHDEHGPVEDHHHDSDHVHQHDHNLWSAYLHVAADALTSVLAIVALLAGKYFGQVWLDPAMGIVGAVLVTRWSWDLLRSSGRVLLDMQAPESLRRSIRDAIERRGDDRVSDLHVWSVGPAIYAAEIGVIAREPLAADAYRELLPRDLGLVHVTIEAQSCEPRAAARVA